MKKNILNILTSITMADKFLLIFFFILMLQIVNNIFFNRASSQEMAAVDTAMRTIVASIFGYFISAGFLDSTENESETKVINYNADSKIGFNYSSEKPLIEAKESTKKIRIKRARQQIFIVGLLGVSSLTMLMLARSCGEITPDSMASFSQLRDFVCSSAGFLVGVSKAVRQ